jgi:predicted NBD/HSP70 family sugar kinase
MTDVTTGRVISAANLAGWTACRCGRSSRRGSGAVRVDNDANMAPGERWQGASASDFMFLALGAGVGAGVMIGGRLHRGHHCTPAKSVA